ncbi:MAG TPA: hypothetical protein VLE19_10820 [Pyrinomonadaceae bacterium]|nr:hypothetical protein [Pyrinomonadaceae bacterium]
MAKEMHDRPNPENYWYRCLAQTYTASCAKTPVNSDTHAADSKSWFNWPVLQLIYNSRQRNLGTFVA